MSNFLPGQPSSWPPSRRVSRELIGPAATRELGRLLGAACQGGEVIALSGDLGAGKTTLVQGLAEGLGLSAREVGSPTFVLVVSHAGERLALHHVDLYRLDAEAAAELGLEELMAGPGSERAVTALEWAERAPELLPADRVEVSLAWAGEEIRRGEILALGPRSRAVMDLVFKMEAE